MIAAKQMRARTRVRWIALAAFLAAVPVGAQWPPRETPGVPRTADGEVDWTAPTPRMANGKPDLSGFWRQRGNTPFGFPDGRGSDMADGRYVSRPGSFLVAASLPYTSHASELLKEREARQGGDNPRAHCRPMGIMQLHTQASPVKYVQTPGLLLMLFEGNRELRQVFTDGRPLPPRSARPQANGYSVGRWEGDTLVVETSGFRDDGWLDTVGSPLTSEGRITERIRRPWYGRIEFEITIEDPRAYRRPFTVGFLHFPIFDQELIEFVCRENNRYSRRFPAAASAR